MPLEYWNLFIGSFAALIALGTGALVWVQTRQHFRYARSSSYIERFNSAEYFDARLVVDNMILEDPAFEKLLRAEVGREPEVDERQRLQVLMFMNIFQEIGAAHRARIIDRRYTWYVFGYLAQNYWEKLGPLVRELRRVRNRRELYSDFEYLASELKKLDAEYSKS